MSQTASESERPGASVLGNTAWLLLPRGARIATGLVVGVLVTRHLGPERFGILAFALALAGLFGALSKLGLDGFIVRDLVRSPAQQAPILRTMLVTKFAASLLAMAACVGAARLLRPHQPEVWLACALCGLHFVFRAGEVVEFALRAQRHMRPIGVAQTLGLLTAALASLTCIAVDAPTAWFAAPFALEALLATGLVMAAARSRTARRTRHGGQGSAAAEAVRHPAAPLGFDGARARQLLGESWPLWVSSVLALVALQIDQVMLGLLSTQDALGHYAAAVRLASLLYVLPMVASQAAQPGVVTAREASKDAYHAHLQRLFTLLAAVSYVVALPLFLASAAVVGALYGPSFASAGPVLGVLVWAGPLVAIAAPRGLWLTNESLARYALLANLVAAASNVALNLLWIPTLGILGAAYATVVSYLGSHLLATLLFPGGRRIFVMQVRALCLLDLPRAAAWALAQHEGKAWRST